MSAMPHLYETQPTAPGKEPIIGILVVSDRASAGIYADAGGPAIRAELNRILVGPWQERYCLVPDEASQIAAALVGLCDEDGCCLVVTTGGTGPAARDVTPEATEEVVDKLLPGFGELMRQVSFTQVPTAILSRQIAGTRGHSLIINLPGKPSSIHDCLAAVFPAVPYCIDLIGGARLETDPVACAAFRPREGTPADARGRSGPAGAATSG